jgi:putative endonuclease
MYTLYILSCADKSLYTGIAKDLEKRLDMHRGGTGAKYVRGRLPFSVVYTEACKDRSSATKREMEIKKMGRADKLKLIKNTPSP